MYVWVCRMDGVCMCVGWLVYVWVYRMVGVCMCVG